MKRNIILWSATVSSLVIAACFDASAATTIDAGNKYAYASNLGWVNWRGNTNNGAIIGEYVCSGYIYSANVGWINLGSGSPANQIQYQNNSATDFGVNHDGLGNLSGYAYGANIGWIQFEQTYGQPRVDLFTGKLSGSVYSANCGWISLSNAFAFVRTTNIQKAPLAPDGLPVGWLLQNFGTTNVSANADDDDDGASNEQEYLAGTDPNSAKSVLQITSFTRGTPTPAYTTLQWKSVNTRYYVVQERSSLTSGAWMDYSSLPIAGWNNAGFDDYDNTNKFFRVRAYRPLTP